jgi:hypothetical protein
MVDEREFRDVRSVFHRVGDRGLVAERYVETQVSTERLVHDRRINIERACSAHRRWQWLVCGRDHLRGVHSLERAGRDDRRNDIPDVAHDASTAVASDDRGPRRLAHPRSVARVDAPKARQLAEALGAPVVPGEHAEHARHGVCLRRVDIEKPGVCVRTPYEDYVRLALRAMIADKATVSAKQSLVLATHDAATYRHANRVLAQPCASMFARGGSLASARKPSIVRSISRPSLTTA